jgi:hypothetical protein
LADYYTSPLVFTNRFFPVNIPVIKQSQFRNGEQLNGELAKPKGDLLFALPENRLLVLEEDDEEIEEGVTRYAIYESRENR